MFGQRVQEKADDHFEYLVDTTNVTENVNDAVGDSVQLLGVLVESINIFNQNFLIGYTWRNLRLVSI